MNESVFRLREPSALDRASTGKRARSFVARLPRVVVVSVLVVESVVIAAAVAFVVASFMPSVYAARSEIMFQSLQGTDVPEQYRATQSVIATGHRVLQPAAVEVGAPVAQLEKNLTIDFPRGGSVMRLQYSSENPAVALKTLVAILDEYNAVLGETGDAAPVTHQLLQPPFLLDSPVQPLPLRAAALGAAVGLAIGLGGLALVRLGRERW